jgi:hypothetical protein
VSHCIGAEALIKLRQPEKIENALIQEQYASKKDQEQYQQFYESRVLWIGSVVHVNLDSHDAKEKGISDGPDF